MTITTPSSFLLGSGPKTLDGKPLSPLSGSIATRIPKWSEKSPDVAPVRVSSENIDSDTDRKARISPSHSLEGFSSSGESLSTSSTSTSPSLPLSCRALIGAPGNNSAYGSLPRENEVKNNNSKSTNEIYNNNEKNTEKKNIRFRRYSSDRRSGPNYPRRPSFGTIAGSGRAKSFEAHNHLEDGEMAGPLNTNTPRALAAAAAITNERIGKFLIATGPLSIRHITTHLSVSVPNFAELSLSKQRRLIMSVLDVSSLGDDAKSPSNSNGYSFEKVGWGRWAAKKVSGSTSAKTTPIIKAISPKLSSSVPNPRRSSISFSVSRKSSHGTNSIGNGSSVIAGASSTHSLTAPMSRRESISDNLYQRGHYLSVPISPLLGATNAVNTSTQNTLISRPSGTSNVESPLLEDDDMLLDNETLFDRRGRGHYLESAILDDESEASEDSENSDDDVDDYRSNYSLYARSTLTTSARLKQYRIHQANRTPLAVSQKIVEIGCDTDEEDWQTVGAASLRSVSSSVNEIPIRSQSVSLSPLFSSQSVSSSYTTPSPSLVPYTNVGFPSNPHLNNVKQSNMRYHQQLVGQEKELDAISALVSLSQFGS
ncbi:hypothetical protein NADFUDRAFT_44033 [Nadsonia fulvescens var. elongata DSM 6958]|uniref:Uncharacterized protein n=1 Tax=Nadsonia fulvescens var. elongata DSM 6958 TaxID=857566 RepID=A0A1E3PFK2_9ASCO|nr:hypothetical protein NADFUDRAFT_44033 [Nadsonia fulvescens var. elongata DSM 6958]